MIKVGIIGATGYAGGELVRILTGHKDAEIVWYGSRSYIDKKYADVYDDICDQIDGKENGTYLLLSKFEEDVVFEYHITIRDEDFNLGVLTMKTPEGTFEVDFDA